MPIPTSGESKDKSLGWLRAVALYNHAVVVMPEGVGLHPFPDLCRVREQRCPSPSHSLCNIGQRGVSAASPIVSGESLATADMVTALLETGNVELAIQKKKAAPDLRANWSASD